MNDSFLASLRKFCKDDSSLEHALALIEQKFQRSEKKLRAILDSTVESIILLAPDYSVLACNKKAQTDTTAFLGKPIQEGDDFRTVLTSFKQEESDHFYTSFQKAASGGRVQLEYEMNFGSFRTWLETTYFPVYDEQSALIGVAINTIDIGKKKQAEVELKKRETRLAETSRLAKIGSWEFDLATEKITWSEETFRIYDRPVEKGEPSYAELLQHLPKSYPIFIAAVERAINDGVGYELDLELMTEIGAEKQVILIGNPVFEDGKLVRLVGFAQDITERKRQESDKKRVQAQLADILEKTTDGYLSLDKDRRFTFVNQMFERLVGVKRVDLIGQNIWDTFRPAVSTMFFENLEKVLRERVAVKFKEYYEPLVGWFDVYAYPSEDGGLTAYVRNFTEEKLREKSLQESEDFLRSIYYGIGTSIFVMDVEATGKFRAVGLNPTFEMSNHIPNYELLGKTIDEWDKFYSKETLDKFNETLSLCVATGEPQRYERRVVFSDRKKPPIVFLVQLSPLFDASGKVYRIIGTTIDITERRAVEDKLIKSEAMLSETERIAHIGSWELGVLDGKVTWSSEVFRIFDRDFSAGEPTLAEHAPYFDSSDMQRLEGFVKNAIEQFVPYQYEAQLTTLDGKKKWVQAVGKPLIDASGKVIRLYGTIMDITARKEAELEKEAMYQQLLQSQKMESLGILASGVAHEFNNILAGILGNAQLLKRQFAPDSKERVKIERIEQSSERAAAIVKQMLGFARKNKINSQRFSLQECVEAVTQIVETTIDKRIRISLDASPNLPLIEGDKGQLEQVVLNLTVNAIDAITSRLQATKLDFGKLHFELTHGDFPARWSAYRPDGNGAAVVHLAVSDNGGGIPKEIHEKIFEPFFTTKPVGKGTGLGLAMVYGIVKNHNGHIFLDSVEGNGTTFHLLFPTAQSRASIASTENLSLLRGMQQGRILVIDDEEAIRIFTAEALESEGYTVQTAGDSATGIELFEQDPYQFDAVVLDLNMPDMNGSEVLVRLRQIRPSAKVIIFTGYLENNEATELTRNGAFEILRKPVTINDMLDLLRS